MDPEPKPVTPEDIQDNIYQINQIAKNSMEALIARNGNLEALQQQADGISISASTLYKQAETAKKSIWRNNMFTTVGLLVVIFLLFLFVFFI